ncbi:amidase signature domain-containing protein [Aspergillus leporis]|jgi:amidase|uniref:Amidase signature domain-containing protein n=1 Tax=Aspergillus leporis TaxID=41062 RepID=A0A5N5WY21_9EURO|nr:amidase signature domain-containing protein [Aspergillus leporis]
MAGSYALQDAVLPEDSTVAAKLRQQGLVILGKTSLAEWSMFRADNWGHAWNPICGQTYGAYYPRQCPSGSSSGSAVAADLHGKRIGIARNVIEESTIDISYTVAEFNRAVSIMKTAGAVIVENTHFTAFSEWKKREYNPVTRADFASEIVQFLSKLARNPNSIHTLESLREFTRSHPSERYPELNTANWDVAIERQLSNACPEYDTLYKENLFLDGTGGILGALERHSLDAIVLPTVAAFEIPALVGTPIVTVPLSAASADTPVTMETSGDVVEMAPGIPFGISFLGPK